MDILPTSPTKFAHTVSDILKNVTPRRSAAIKFIGIRHGEKEERLIKATKKGFKELIAMSNKKGTTKEQFVVRSALQNSVSRILKKYRLLSSGCRNLGLRRATASRKTKSPQKKNFLSFTKER